MFRDLGVELAARDVVDDVPDQAQLFQDAQIHGDFLRASVERAAEVTKRYFEVAQAIASTVSTANEQARKTA